MIVSLYPIGLFRASSAWFGVKEDEVVAHGRVARPELSDKDIHHK